MNIVQLQYKLRDLPESTVKAAANGQIPDIPEMLATMELNRRARVENAGAKPPTKSIKEQLEEKLSAQPKEQMGLPGMLQQAQQANGEPQQEQVQQQGQPQMPPQQMAQQGMPQQMPQQPPAQQLRMGGVAGLPSNMFKQFYGGGIVAFAGGDLVENESAAETARLKRAEEIAAARELLDVTGSNPPAESVAPTAPVSEDIAKVNQTVMSAPFVQQAAQDLQTLRSSGKVTTPEEEMDKRQALLDKYGIRPPKEEELARIEASNKAYDRDRQERAQYQALRALAAGARPNVYGRYMPGTIGETVSSFGLSNLDADRAFREANEKAFVSAKEAQRAFKMDNLSDAITQSRKTEEYEREKIKAVATAAAQMASHGMSAQASIMSREEEKRYHDMWKDIQDKDLKIKAAQAAATARSNIPELFRNIEEFEKRYPDIAKNLDSEKKIELGAEILRIRSGAPSRAETAYDAQVIDVQRIRQTAKQKATETDQKLLDGLRMAKKPDQKQIQELERRIQDKKDEIDRNNPLPTPPSGGIASILKPNAPAQTANAPEKTDKSKSKDTTIKYDNQGRIISQ